LIGKTISHYQILEKLGGGGMGVVYKAEDTKLKRTVALKFLPPELTRDEISKKRFIHEAQAASALQHNNICTIHEIGETPDGQMFICMDCYDGETLKKKIERGPLPVLEAIDITRKIAAGLAKAHAAGMVHRDIKPANLMMTDDGVMKILDFGLAKLAGRTQVTKTGTTVGTVAYMSPEQASGRDVDHRSDIFSLGVLLYELLTGQLPFRGDHEAAVLYGIMHNDAEPLATHRADLPPGLQRVVEKALCKYPSSRYQAAADIIADLKSIQVGRTTPDSDVKRQRKTIVRTALSLAVVALVIVGGYAGYQRFKKPRVPIATVGEENLFVVAVAPFWGQNTEALEEGKVMQALVERRLVQELGDDKTVAVLGKKQVVEAPQSHDDAKAMGEELGATIVLWGEVLVLREEVEIQPYVTLVKWIRGAKDRSTESMQTNLEGSNQLSLRKAKAEDVGQVALQVAGTFYIKKDPEKALALLQKIIPPTPESLIEQGNVFLDRGAWSKSKELYKRAIDLAPDEARPYSRMAGVYRSQKDYDTAINWSKKAIEVDSTYQYPYAMVGWALIRQRKYDDAIRWLQNALALFPQSYMVHVNMGSAYNLQGRYDDAEVWSDRCIDVAGNPFELANAFTFKGTILRNQGKYDEGERWFERAIESDPEQWYAYSNIGMINYKKQAYEEAIKWFERLTRLAPTHVHAQLPASYMILGRYSEAAVTLRRMMEIRPGDHYSAVLYITCLYHMGENEKAREHAAMQAKALDDEAWIAPVIRFYAGEFTEEEVLKGAEAEDPKKDNEQKCEAYYYLGMAQLFGLRDGVQPDTTLAREYFEKCVSTGVEGFMEFTLAKQMLESR
jgi:tetratricopeptide (TPR) repeat protein/tRNA A-37 threonylcarbamoyl transferase component Bud32